VTAPDGINPAGLAPQALKPNFRSLQSHKSLLAGALYVAEILGIFGSGGRDRTYDQLIKIRLVSVGLDRDMP
jgi:hypothetical protein